jgi:DMSO/TMAO reductase YedYZ molybdopterin-dependent catalytic subunit
MALFIVRHHHPAGRCPAADPQAGAEVLDCLNPASAGRRGVAIRGEAIVQDEHALYLILESSDEDRVREFVKPLARMGSVDIHPASTWAEAVARGGCAAPPLAAGEAATAAAPEEACQEALESGLLMHRAHPLNCETPIPALLGGVIMPSAHFYVRNHFHIPRLDPSRFRLEVGGLVEHPLSLSLQELHKMRSQTRVVTLECAGNGRGGFDPPIEGENWGLGAVSTAEWTGVPLVDVLDLASISAKARELVFRGADSGNVLGGHDVVRYERGLSVADARHSDALLAYAMNGEPLPIQHGFPLRVVLPRWYGMGSVKWLTEIEAVDDRFHGYFHANAYFYEWLRGGEIVREPVTLQRVRSLITEPLPGTEVEGGEQAIRGVAWSGSAPVARVDVRVGDGPWQRARLVGERHDHGWRRWELITRVDCRGSATIRARATDLAGHTQPGRPPWNRLGYGNNAIHEVSVRVP